MLARLAYMIFLAGGAVWLWAAGLSDLQTWIVGFAAVLFVFRMTDTAPGCSCRANGECRSPSLRFALFCAALGLGLGLWTIADGGFSRIREDADIESFGRLFAWPAVIFIAPFASLAIEAKWKREMRSAEPIERIGPRDDWKGE